jgi:hypothetical protein
MDRIRGWIAERIAGFLKTLLARLLCCVLAYAAVRRMRGIFSVAENSGQLMSRLQARSKAKSTPAFGGCLKVANTGWPGPHVKDECLYGRCRDRSGACTA